MGDDRHRTGYGCDMGAMQSKRLTAGGLRPQHGCKLEDAGDSG